MICNYEICFLAGISQFVLTYVSLCLAIVLESLPPARYRETISTLLAWLQQCEAKLAVPSTAVTEYPIMEQRQKDVQVNTHMHTIYIYSCFINIYRVCVYLKLIEANRATVCNVMCTYSYISIELSIHMLVVLQLSWQS